MKPLSIYKFLKGSGKKILPLVITLSLATALLYFLAILQSYVVVLNKDVNTSYLSNMSIVLGGGSGVANEDIEKFMGNQEIKDYLVMHAWKANYKAVNSSQTFLLLLKEQDVAKVLSYQKWELIAGEMPQNGKEILLSQKLAANNSLVVGSVVNKKTKGWEIGEDLKVTGIFDGEAVIGLGCHEGIGLNIGDKSTSLLVFSQHGRLSELNALIEELFGKKYEVLTLDRANLVMDKIISALNTVMMFIGIVVITALSVLLGNICMIQYTQRSKEFELLYALGYTKKYIAVKVLKEIGLSTLIGYAAGILFAMASGWLVELLVLSEKAVRIDLIQEKSMLWILLVPLCVTLIGIITPLKLLKFNHSL